MAAEITRKLNKQKKCSKREREPLVAITLASSGNSSSAPEECEWTKERPMKKKSESSRRRLKKWNGRHTCLFLYPNPRKRNLFSRRSL